MNESMLIVRTLNYSPCPRLLKTEERVSVRTIVYFDLFYILAG